MAMRMQPRDPSPGMDEALRAFGPPTDSEEDIGDDQVEMPAFDEPRARPIPSWLDRVRGERFVAQLSTAERMQLMLDDLINRRLVGSDHSALARFEAQLAAIRDPGARERLLMFFVANGYSPEGPEIQLATLSGGLVELAQDIPDAMEAAAESIVDRAVARFEAAVDRALARLEAAAEKFADLPQQIDQAFSGVLGAARAQFQLIGEISDRHEAALRETLGAGISEESFDAAARIEERKTNALLEVEHVCAQAQEKLATFEAAAEQRLAIAAQKVVSDSAEVLKKAVSSSKAGPEYMTMAVLVLGGIVFGMIALAIIQRL